MHFARVCQGRKVTRSGKQFRALEAGLEPSETCGQDDAEKTEDVYLYQLAHGKSRHPTVTLEVNSIQITLHLDTQADVTVVTEKTFESLKSTSRLQPTKAVIRSFLGD